MSAPEKQARDGRSASLARHVAPHPPTCIQEALNGLRSNASQVKAYYDNRGRFIHFCEHPGCDSWGAVGFGVSLARGILGRWFCVQHAAEYEAALVAARAQSSAKMNKESGRHTQERAQGSLF